MDEKKLKEFLSVWCVPTVNESAIHEFKKQLDMCFD